MAYKLDKNSLNQTVKAISEKYHVYAPCLLKGWGVCSDTDIISYKRVFDAEELVFDQKSMYSFKEAILPISETLFYFTDDDSKEPKPAYEQAVVFLRNCDLHALSRLDAVYRSGGNSDFYYERLRQNVKFIVMGCETGFEGCFCASMGTSELADYDAYIAVDGEGFVVDSRCDKLTELLQGMGVPEATFAPKAITNELKVEVPENIPQAIITHPVWDEYTIRCIKCGRCNFVCPTCTCFSTQDIFYGDNENAGERRRVWASCQVEGYTDMAGGMSFRKTGGEQMRFKVLHKISDHKKRHGENMCVGCGRCDAVCPEYISYTACIEKVKKACEEVSNG